MYQLRNSGIITITKDQTELQKLLDEGILSKQRALKYHRRNILLSVISANSDYHLQTENFEIKEGDRLLSMTDGAYSLISKTEIRDISISNHEITTFLEGIKQTIKTKEIKDDYSVVAFQAE